MRKIKKLTESSESGVYRFADKSAKIMAVAFAAFLSIFSFDAFKAENTILQNAVSLLIHLIPVFMILITLIFAWRRPAVAMIIYPLLAIAYIIWAWGRFPLSVYFLIAGPLFVIGFLFWLGSRHSREEIIS